MPTILNTYKGPPKGLQYEAWREVACREFCGLDIQPSEGDAIDCQLRIDPIGELVLAAPNGWSAQFSRTEGMLSDGCDDLVLVEASWGSVGLVQAKKSIELRGAQFCLTDMSVLGSIGHGPKGAFRTLRIPRRTLLSVSPGAEDRLSVVVNGHEGLRETIARYQTLCSELSSQLDATGQHLMAQHLVDLIGLLLKPESDDRDSSSEGRRAGAQLDLIRADALRNLSQHGLSIGSLAGRYGLGERQAQRLFERSGSTFTEFVLEQRLLLARKRLADPTHRHRKISDIAHACGFSDLSYFNRAFRKRFGISPGEMRSG